MTDAEHICDLAYDDVLAGSDSDEWDPLHLRHSLFVVWAVTKAQETTNNGGFQYFFEADWPNTPYEYFVDAFEETGASEAAQVLRSAVGEFSFPNPHLDCERRNRIMDESRAAAAPKRSKIEELGYRMIRLNAINYQRLMDYVIAHRDDFPSVQKEFAK